ncbi:ribulose-phosphate 3-epimerase [Batrachochytrium salamandrivorans]|nr:ribulose-phosphate 3-epimerase [Batrachochytrium salamandrivorans]
MSPESAAKRERVVPKPLKAIVSPSILDCDKAEWGASLDLALKGSAEWLHFDVMDGHFVPNLSFGPMVIASLRKKFPNEYFDVHFMVSEPEKYVDMLASGSSGASGPGLLGFTFHIETTEPRGITLDLIDKIRAKGMDVGIALSPNTPIDAVLPYCHLIDLLLVMTVHPGFGGQKFMKDQMQKVSLVRSKHPNLNIQVDGGVSPGETVEACAQAGANVIVSGSGVFLSKDVKAAIHALRKAVNDSLPGIAA